VRHHGRRSSTVAAETAITVKKQRMNPTFDQVSDTNLLVAAARAMETDREDGL
jgi:hypothetical protein